jgi:hypothetical protein
MRATIVYESMFGNTRVVAEAIAEGFGPGARVVPVAEADPDAGADLLVVGGPTHGWGMSRPNTRKGAPGFASKSDSGLAMEPGAQCGPGVRDWTSSLAPSHTRGAAFDTRISGPAIMTGRASKGIGRALKRHGITLVARPESFLVDRKSHLLPGEADRARAWGAHLAATVGTTLSGQAGVSPEGA